MKRVAILGAGLTGLTAAWRLSQRGHEVRVFEAHPSVGGPIQSESVSGWLIEAGPNTLLADAAVESVLAELGLTADLQFAAPEARHRYVLRDGQPRPLPMSPPALLQSPLFSGRAKLALLREMWMRPRARTSDVSLEDFFLAHLNREWVDYAVNPFVTGIYAGNPRKLSARHAFPKLWELEQRHGSLLRGQWREARAHPGPRPRIVSFREGLQQLPRTLAARLPPGALRVGARVEALLPGPPWSVIWRAGLETQTESFDAVVAALPAPALAALRFGELGERPFVALDTIEHPPVTSVFLGYRRAEVTHPLDGFGLLVPEVEACSLLGVLFSSTLFPGRAPAGHVALTVLVGGTRQPDLAGLSAPALLTRLEPDLLRLLGVRGAPVLHRQRLWPRAIPQYDLGYERFLDVVLQAERGHRGLHVGGQVRDGISLASCLAAGERLARAVAGPDAE